MTGIRASASSSPRRGLPRVVWIVGLVSLMMDASSELVHSLLPLLMASTFGASMATIGLVEGVAEATASVTKVLSGVFSDRWRRRKPLVVLGYLLSACSKPAFPLAPSLAWVAGARFTDRVGKGIRGAPRDALVADLTPAHQRGAAFGLRQALDSIGAVVGPALAMLLMWWLAGDIRRVMWFAVVPATVAVALTFAIREPEPAARRHVTIRIGDAAALPRRYWFVVAAGVVFTLARFSDAFLVLRANSLGLSATDVPLVMAAMSATYAVGSYPAGRAADRFGGRMLLVSGLLVLVAADVILAMAASWASVLIGAAAWGLHMALTQGLFSKLVADTASERVRGTAFGLFNLTTGVALFAASALAGWLWTAFGPATTFATGATFAALATIGLVGYRPTRAASSSSSSSAPR